VALKPFGALLIVRPSQAPRPLRYPTVALPLTQVSVTFFSPKEAHPFFIIDVLWAIYDGNHFALGTNGRAGTDVLSNFFELALLCRALLMICSSFGGNIEYG
jgi:hypothetical protein